MSAPRRALIVWLVFVAACAWVATSARFTADMSAFLPAAATPTQRLLVGELREGVASRLLLRLQAMTGGLTRDGRLERLAAAIDEAGAAQDDWLPKAAKRFLDELVWYAEALRARRATGTPY